MRDVLKTLAVFVIPVSFFLAFIGIMWLIYPSITVIAHYTDGDLFKKTYNDARCSNMYDVRSIPVTVLDNERHKIRFNINTREYEYLGGYQKQLTIVECNDALSSETISFTRFQIINQVCQDLLKELWIPNQTAHYNIMRVRIKERYCI